MAPKSVLTPQAEDFPRWYQDVVAKAEMADNGPVRGTMVIRPYGYAIWERIQREIDERIKRAGAQNAYFPLFIPESYLSREAEHVEGFSPELAVVTHAGGEKLAEPIVVRPTSETVIGEFMAKWIQSYRDLPLAAQPVGERRALGTAPSAVSSLFGVPLARGPHRPRHARGRTGLREPDPHGGLQRFPRKGARGADVPWHQAASERFAGAINSLTCEGMMRDGKALQMATSHELGQNFAKAFEIYYQSEEGQAELCYTTSWGSSTRLVGGLIMAHGDDQGLLLPPAVAPTQAVVIAVRDEPEVNEACERVAVPLGAAGVRSVLDRRARQLRATRHRLGDQGRAAARRSRPARPHGRRRHRRATRQRGQKLTWHLDGRRALSRRRARDDPTRPLCTRARVDRDVNTLDVARSSRRSKPPRPVSRALPGISWAPREKRN